MDKKMKKYVTILISIFIFIVMINPIQAIVEDNGQYCNDSAGILSTSTISTINSRGASIERQYGAQVVVVTVKTTEGLSTQDYAIQLFNGWGLGDPDKNNGVLILIVTEQKDYWIMQGDGIKSIVSDSFLSNVVYNYQFNDMVDYGNDYNTRINDVHKSICSHLQYYYQSISNKTNELTYPVKIALSAIWGSIVILLAYRILKNKKTMKELEGVEILPAPKLVSTEPKKKEKAPKVKKSEPKRTPSPPQTTSSYTPFYTFYEEESRSTPKTVVRSPRPTTRTHTSSRVSGPVSKPASKPSSPSSPVSRSRGSGGGRSSGGGVGRH
ncbi:TPM domain-containing protein [Beduini massiliensis]|uniref:TPM domain-containing protein n=2 Tax=Beduini massiliensis TaxID=1585974 RepID=UPI003563B8BE